MIRECRTFAGVLECSRAVFEIQYRTFIDDPAATTKNVLYVMIDNIHESKGTFVVDVDTSVSTNDIVPPNKGGTKILSVLFEIDDTIIVACLTAV